MKLALVLHTEPFHHHTASLIGIAKAARARGDEVMVFAMSVGVGVLLRDDFMALVAEGVNITVCDHNRAEYKGPEGLQGVKYGSQYDLAGYIHDFDRTVSFM